MNTRTRGIICRCRGNITDTGIGGGKVSLTPLGRYAVAEDIAGAIGALLSEGNRFVTGQRIEVSGGIHL